MPFKTHGLDPLSAVINVRLTATEKTRLKEDADLAGLSLSELVRRRYFGKPDHCKRRCRDESRNCGALGGCSSTCTMRAKSGTARRPPRR